MYTGISVGRSLVIVTTACMITIFIVVANKMYEASAVAEIRGMHEHSKTLMNLFYFHTFLAAFYGLRSLK